MPKNKVTFTAGADIKAGQVVTVDPRTGLLTVPTQAPEVKLFDRCVESIKLADGDNEMAVTWVISLILKYATTWMDGGEGDIEFRALENFLDDLAALVAQVPE